MRPPTRLAIAAAAALLTACATPYKPESFTHQGYSEQRRGPGVYAVWFRGNVLTPIEQCEEFAILHAAELCLAESKPFMRTSDFQTTIPPVHYVPSSEREPPRSGLKVECLADHGEDAQETALVAASIRKRYGLKSSGR